MKLPEYAYRQSPGVQIPNPGVLSLPGAPPTGAGELLGAVSELNRNLVEAEQRVEASRRAVQKQAILSEIGIESEGMIARPDTTMPAAVWGDHVGKSLTQRVQDRVRDHPDESFRNDVVA